MAYLSGNEGLERVSGGGTVAPGNLPKKKPTSFLGPGNALPPSLAGLEATVQNMPEPSTIQPLLNEPSSFITPDREPGPGMNSPVNGGAPQPPLGMGMQPRQREHEVVRHARQPMPRRTPSSLQGLARNRVLY